MKIITESAKKDLAAFAYAISQDANSWKKWFLVNISINDEEEHEDIESMIDIAASELSKEMLSYDGHIFIHDNHIITIAKTKSNGEALPVDNIEKIFKYLPSNKEMTVKIDINMLGESSENTINLLNDLGIEQKKREITDLNMKTMDSTIEYLGDFGGLLELMEYRQEHNLASEHMHIMLVEDDDLTRKIASRILKEDYKLVTATDAEEAVANYVMYAPEMVLLDINLPDGSGFDVLAKILEVDPEAYVVMFSGNDYYDNIDKALNSGAKGFISKPFKKEQMLHYINNSAKYRALQSAKNEQINRFIEGNS